jgi:hypothetical protein
MGPFSNVVHISETGSEISDVEEASNRTGIYEAVAPYRQLYVLQIIRFWAQLLRELQCVAQSVSKEGIPFFSKLFAEFENDDAYIRTRKTWDRI